MIATGRLLATYPPRSYFFASGFQFKMTVMGEAASSVMVFIRNR
jgi:hypothetical protein